MPGWHHHRRKGILLPNGRLFAYPAIRTRHPMDLRQLSYLVTVSEERGVRAAARRLHISQPQISRTLRDLELELGVELVHRRSDGVGMTAAGEELVAHAREILQRAAAARAAMRRIGERHSTALRVGVVA